MHLTKTLLVMNLRCAGSHRTNRKLLLAMKLTAAFLLISVMHVSARGTAQTITYSAKDESLISILNQVKKQTGYNIIYWTSELKNAGRISIEFSNDDIQSAMEKVFKDKPFQFSIQEKTV
ncbi:MAG: hypothetical protein J7497_16465, partial [Chitinophagaceae bacterium]|nr:hypothetical protein [Chitinophagaceae bacterium]